MYLKKVALLCFFVFAVQPAQPRPLSRASLLRDLLETIARSLEEETRQTDGGVTLYFSTVSSNLEIKKHQQKITMVLDGKKIPYTIVDTSSSDSGKAKMREIAGDPKALPPQLANGDQYCGDYGAFDKAVEEETIESFLKLQ